MHLRNTSSFLLLGAALLASACSQQKASSLSVSSKGVAPASAAVPSAGAVAVGGGFIVDRVRVAVREVELSGGACEAPGTTRPAPMPAGSGMVLASHDGGSGDGHGMGGGDDSGEDHGDCKVEVGPFLVDLTGDQLAGAVHRAFDASVPAGTYDELEIKVCPVAATVAGFADMNGAAVVIDGSAPAAQSGGAAAPFHLELDLCAELERETSLTVGASSSNVTLTIDPMKWFSAADGRILDPGSAADRAAIAANVRASIDAFDDDDRDGEEDHHGGEGHGGDDGAGHH
jgi:hypothetical protein